MISEHHLLKTFQELDPFPSTDEKLGRRAFTSLQHYSQSLYKWTICKFLHCWFYAHIIYIQIYMHNYVLVSLCPLMYAIKSIQINVLIKFWPSVANKMYLTTVFKLDARDYHATFQPEYITTYIFINMESYFIWQISFVTSCWLKYHI